LYFFSALAFRHPLALPLQHHLPLELRDAGEDVEHELASGSGRVHADVENSKLDTLGSEAVWMRQKSGTLLASRDSSVTARVSPSLDHSIAASKGRTRPDRTGLLNEQLLDASSKEGAFLSFEPSLLFKRGSSSQSNQHSTPHRAIHI
jgi:hypothetical protein